MSFLKLTKRIWVNSILAAGLAVTLAGCGSEGESAAVSTNGEGEVDLSKVTLVLGDQAGLTKSKIEASGVLEDTPYKVEWASFQGAAPLFEAVNAGSVDTAPAGDTPVLTAAASGVPIKIAASTKSATSAIGIIVQENSSVQKVADLKGKTIVISSAEGSVAQYLVIEALKREGLSTDDVEIKFVLPTDASAAFQAGDIEIWATFDPYLTIAKDKGGRILIDGEGISSGVGFMTVSEEALKDPGKKAALQDLFQRFADAWEWERTNQEEYIGLYSEITGLSEDVSKAINGKVTPEFHPVTEEEIEKVQKVADTFTEEGVLDKKVNIGDLIDHEIFTEVE